MAVKFTESEIGLYTKEVGHPPESQPKLPYWVDKNIGPEKVEINFLDYKYLLDEIFLNKMSTTTTTTATTTTFRKKSSTSIKIVRKKKFFKPYNLQ